ncbi:hypothetical protein DU19_0783 [Chlamydia muridarum]|nr:hypothetical protein DU17_0785 [Chlamydia muridarum]KDU81731.1 hypothetical protein DU18_0783 [Chlamydia muridarum]KDU82901.1 hypothetical protein DU19_0783 [Chlamydia muridarum]KDU83686.1 hypothetical protein DU20_0783 [Chlamydia muridarum]KDU84051.1 hypothetical protein DU21_0785 [Chlamydia muridarum]
MFIFKKELSLLILEEAFIKINRKIVSNSLGIPLLGREF